MPLRNGKKVAQKIDLTTPAGPVSAKAILTPEQIIASLVQHFEGQCQTQQQIDDLVPYKNNVRLLVVVGLENTPKSIQPA